MSNLQYEILKYMLYKPRTVEQVMTHLNLFRRQKVSRPVVQRAMDDLDERGIIEELGKEERKRFLVTGEETTGPITDLDGFYLATESCGQELGESAHEDRRRFYMPLLLSLLLSIISIAISLTALLR